MVKASGQDLPDVPETFDTAREHPYNAPIHVPCDESESPQDMYEELDQMLRFQADRMKRRRAKDPDALQPLEVSDI